MSKGEKSEPHPLRNHLDEILLSKAFGKAENQRLLLEYLVDRALAGEKVTTMEIAQDVFHGHDQKAESKAKSAKRHLRLKLKDYYEGEGKRSNIRIILPQRGFLPFVDTSELQPPVVAIRVTEETQGRRFFKTKGQTASELASILTEGTMPRSPQPTLGSTARSREFLEVFEPAFLQLREVHTDYITMFQEARTSTKGKMRKPSVMALADRLNERRIGLEVVRMELQSLFSELQELPTEPHIGQFVNASLAYVRPRETGTSAFNLIHKLRAAVTTADINSKFDLATFVSNAIDEELRHLRALMTAVTHAYARLKLAALRQ